MTTKAEIEYQGELADKISTVVLPGAFVIRNNPREIQGIPDLLVLHGPRWAMLEVKMYEDSKEQPNQGYYVEYFNGLSFGAFIHHDNEEEVLHALQRSLGAPW